MTLIAHWPFDDHMFRDDTDCRDIAGGGSGYHHGTYNNSHFTGLFPTGVGSRHAIVSQGEIHSFGNAADLRLLGSITFMSWFWPSYGYFGYHHSYYPRPLFSCYVSDGGTELTNNPYIIKTNGSSSLEISWQYGANVDVSVVSDTGLIGTPIDEEPCHVAVVRYAIDAEFGVRFYKNGQLHSEHDNGGVGWTAPTGGGNAVPEIGKGDLYNRGALYDSMRLYDEELTQTAIEAIYDAEYPEVYNEVVVNDDIRMGSTQVVEGLAYPESRVLPCGENSTRENSGWAELL